VHRDMTERGCDRSWPIERRKPDSEPIRPPAAPRGRHRDQLQPEIAQLEFTRNALAPYEARILARPGREIMCRVIAAMPLLGRALGLGVAMLARAPR
jgi:transposase